jgi:hypothetical protein
MTVVVGRGFFNVVFGFSPVQIGGNFPGNPIISVNNPGIHQVYVYEPVAVEPRESGRTYICK